jgi:transposase, IS5 family
MAKPRDDRQKDLLRPALEDIIDLGHPSVRLAREIDWSFLDSRFAGVCAPGQPGLPTRLVAGRFILKHMHDLWDCQEFRAGLGMMGAKEPAHAATQRTSYS